MGFNLNTNTYGLYAHARASEVNTKIGSSLEKLSSGVRINKAADDASGMSIANSLKSQSSSLSQAIRNANDAIGLVQIADNAMDEMTNILNTIKTKSIQSAQDGQTESTRLAIQKDVNRLMEGLDNIAKTTSYNGQNLLSGAFANKEFQVGAYSNETVKLSISATDGEHVGHVRRETFDMTHLNGGDTLVIGKEISLNVDGKGIHTTIMDIKAGTGVGQMASLINSNSDILGVRASYHVETTSSKAIKAGELNNFEINNVPIGNISDIMRNDEDGKLQNAINSKSHLTGVVANVDENGKLHLNSDDGRGINLRNYGSVIPTELSSQNVHPELTGANGITSPSGDVYGPEGFVITSKDSVANIVEINGIDITGTLTAMHFETLDDIATLINAQQHLTFVSAEVISEPNGTQSLKLTGNIEEISGFNSQKPCLTPFTGLALNIQDIDPTDSNINKNSITNFGELTLLGGGANDIITKFGTNLEHGQDINGVAKTVSAPLMDVIVGQVMINGVDVIGFQFPSDIDTTDKLVLLINTNINETGVIASKGKDGELVLDGDIRSLTGFDESSTGKGINAGIKDIFLENEQPITTEIKNLSSLVKENMLLSQKSSMVAMDILTAAMATMDTIRSDIGSVQNQLDSTISNITVTQANIKIAESGIRDVDFAAESAEFNKNKLLAQAGTFALSQANTVQQNVMKLLQ